MASYNLNLIPGDAPVVVPVNQYDRGYTIDFTVYDGDTVFSLAGYTAVINIGKPDKNVYAGGTVVLRGNVATITLEEQMTAMWGPCIAELVFTNSNGRRATANFILDVEKSPLEDGAQSESVINYIESSLEAAEGAATAANEATEAATEAANAANEAAESAANVARNIESMPQVLQSLAATLSNASGSNKILTFNSSGGVEALSGGYVTPQMFGAKGNGTADDTAAFEAALASGERVVVPMATYKLSAPIWTDDSVVVNDSGTYNTKPLIVSKAVRDSAPVERLVKQFNASVANVRDYSLRGACYDSTNDRIVVAYGTEYEYESDNTDLVLTAYDTDFNPITGMSKVVEGAGQGAGLCYNATDHKIYAACCNGSHKIVAINPDDLTFDSWVAPPQSGRVWDVMYDEDNGIYYIRFDNNNGSIWIAHDSTFSPLEKHFISVADDVKSVAGLHTGTDTLYAQQGIVYGGQILQLLAGNKNPGSVYGSNGAFLVQYNYSSYNILKKAYRVTSDYLTGDEPKALVNVGGKIYMLTDIANTAGQRYVSVSQLVLDSRIEGQSKNTMTDAKVLDGDDLNEVLTVGRYVAPTVAVATALTNAPTTQAFVMWVLPVPFTKESRAQIVMTYHGDIFVRSYVAHVSIWYGWRQLAETPRKGATKTGVWNGAGYVTATGTEVRFTIPYPMPTASDSMPSVTVTSCKANIRQNGNYLAESSTELVSASGYVVSATASAFGIDVVITKSSAFANAVNNESCGVSATVTLRFT